MRVNRWDRAFEAKQAVTAECRAAEAQAKAASRGIWSVPDEQACYDWLQQHGSEEAPSDLTPSEPTQRKPTPSE